MAFQSTRDPAQGRLLLLTAILFIAYVCVAVSLPIVPIYVTEQLGLSNAWAGLGVGIAFLTTIVSRGHAGSLSDRRGAKHAVTLGLLFYAAGALISLVAGLAFHAPLVAYLVLIAGRLLLGLGESLVGVGVIAWGVGLVGPARSGKVLALIGAAIYGAFAVGERTRSDRCPRRCLSDWSRVFHGFSGHGAGGRASCGSASARHGLGRVYGIPGSCLRPDRSFSRTSGRPGRV